MIRLYYQVFLSLLLLSIEAKPHSDAILLSKVETLTLRVNGKTAHRRVPAIPQLTCEGPGCAFYKVDIMRCKNQGSSFDQEDIDWSCTANLPLEFKLGSTEVTCEGYANRDDKYVLKRSCGVTYQLLLTDLGQEKYGQFLGFDRLSRPYLYFIFLFVFVGIFILILFSAFKVIPFGNYFRQPGRFWGTGGGGGPWDPPPPYMRKDYSFQQQRTMWEPGFWTGALGGAAAGYFAGNRGNSRDNFIPKRNRRQFNGRDGYFEDDSSRSSGSSSSRYESTGFGSTSRR